jgi:hypothetical protein
MVYCSLNFFTEGAAALPGDDGELRALSDWVVSGPRTRPIASLTLAPLRTVGIVLYPDAFALLTGLAPAALQDRNDPADGLLDASWADWPQALRACADEAAQAAWIEARLSECWRARSRTLPRIWAMPTRPTWRANCASSPSCRRRGWKSTSTPIPSTGHIGCDVGFVQAGLTAAGENRAFPNEARP